MSDLSFFQKPITDLEYPDIQRLFDEKVPESHILDYKAGNYSDSGELAKDICAFANTNGGYLIIGVQEGVKDEKRVPMKIVGVENHPDLQKRLCDMIINSISSRPLVNFSKPIPMPDSDKVILIIYTPKSFDSLHMVMVKGKYQFKYYKRYHDQNVPMDEYEVRMRYEHLNKSEQIVEKRLIEIDEKIHAKLKPSDASVFIALSPLNSSIKFDKKEIVDALDFSTPWNRYATHTKFEIWMNYFEKLDSRVKPSVIMTMYFDGSVAFATTRISKKPERQTHILGHLIAYDLFHILSTFFDYYQKYMFRGYLKLFASIKYSSGNTLIIPSLPFSHPDPDIRILSNEYEPCFRVIETDWLMHRRKDIINEIIQPLFNEAGIPGLIGKCWNQDSTPFYEKYHQ